MKACPAIETTVVILSAGHGTRMLPLTKSTPKPLLKVGSLSLIEHHLVRFKGLGFKNIVINTAYLGEQIRSTLGDGSHYDLDIDYSDEAETGALETAGGLKAALPLIKSDPFIVVNADIWTDYDFSKLLDHSTYSAAYNGACLVMADNPEHNPNGDFGLPLDQDKPQILLNTGKDNRYTYSGIGLYSKSIFEKVSTGKQALGPLLKALCEQKKIKGIIHQGVWHDIGTPERLEEIRRTYK